MIFKTCDFHANPSVQFIELCIRKITKIETSKVFFFLTNVLGFEFVYQYPEFAYKHYNSPESILIIYHRFETNNTPLS